MKKYNSITHGRLTEMQVFDQIKDDILSNPDNEFILYVGTDSQTYSKTKVVSVIALVKKGKGGKYFYTVEILKRTKDLRTKIYNETIYSLEVAKRLVEYMYDNNLENDVIIHADIGNNKKTGKTHVLIQEIVGWVTAEGFKCQYKPHATVASTIADRISK